jgi:hypothetical protein
MKKSTLIGLLNYSFKELNKDGNFEYLPYEQLTERERKIISKKEYEELVKSLKENTLPDLK